MQSVWFLVLHKLISGPFVLKLCRFDHLILPCIQTVANHRKHTDFHKCLLFKRGWKSCDVSHKCVRCHRNHFLPLPNVGEERIWPLHFMWEIRCASCTVRSPPLSGKRSGDSHRSLSTLWCLEVKIPHNNLFDLFERNYVGLVLKCHKWFKKPNKMH